MLTVEKLKSFGANTDEGLGRCMKNEMLYLRLVGMVVNDQNYEVQLKGGVTITV